MTPKEFRKRVELLEAESKMRKGATSAYCLFFTDRDGSREGVDIAKGPADFICHRQPDEELEAFQTRAVDECLALKPKVPIAGIIFMKEAGYQYGLTITAASD
jgi:hypothetical protein